MDANDGLQECLDMFHALQTVLYVIIMRIISPMIKQTLEIAIPVSHVE